MVEAVADLFCYEEVFWIVAVAYSLLLRGEDDTARCCCFAVLLSTPSWRSMLIALHVYIARIPAITFVINIIK